MHAHLVFLLVSFALSRPSAARVFTDPDGYFVRARKASVPGVPAWTSAEKVRSVCSNKKVRKVFECTHVFESGVFGHIRTGTVEDVVDAFGGRDMVQVGTDIEQDPTEGNLHPHTFEKGYPESLVGEYDTIGRELKSSSSAVGRPIFCDGNQGDGCQAIPPVHDQVNAPFYLAFLHEAERRKCKDSARALHRNGIDAPTCLAPDTFRYRYTGRGVNVYAVGEGISGDSADFGGSRISSDHFDARNITDQCSQVCETWQGTHVASLTAGSIHGVAKSAVHIPVAVKPGCHMVGSALDFARGLQWIIEHRRMHMESPAVAMSSTQIAVRRDDRAAIDIIEDLVHEIVRLNVTFVATSGENAVDALDFTPGRLVDTLAVGGLKAFRDVSADIAAASPWKHSNYGEAIDIWAPAALITSAFSTGFGDTVAYSGVSQASGLVAGIVATILEERPHLTPAQVKNLVISIAADDLMTTTRPRSTFRVVQMPTSALEVSAAG